MAGGQAGEEEPEAGAGDQLRSRLRSDLRRHVRRLAGGSAALWVLTVGLLALITTTVVPTRAVAAGIAAAGGLGGLFGWAALRARSGLAAIDRGRCNLVRYEGWSRPPDGSWVAFFDERTDLSVPSALVKLPLRREVGSGEGWSFTLRSAQDTTAVLAGHGGALLAVGRVVPWRDGEKAWVRRKGPAS